MRFAFCVDRTSSNPVAVIENAGYDFTLLLDGDVEAGEYSITATPGVIILDKDRRVRFELRALLRIEPPQSAAADGHRQKAAYEACAAYLVVTLDFVIFFDRIKRA